MSSRFDPAEEDDEEEPEQPETEEETESEPADDPSTEADTTTTPEDTTMSESEATNETASEDAPPDVPYNQPPQRPIHVRDEYWNEYRDTLNFEVERMLAQDSEIRNPKFYEENTAMVRLAAAYPEALAKLILDERGIEIDLSTIGE